MDTEKILNAYTKNMKMQDIYQTFDISQYEFYKLLRANGYEPNRGLPDKTTTRETCFTDTQKQIIDGLLLGDGYMILDKHSINASFLLGNTQIEWINQIKTLLPLKFNMRIRPAAEAVILGKLIHRHDLFTIKSGTDKGLTPIYHRWYPNNKKHVPSDIVITPISMLHWFYGDGTTTRIKKYVSLRFCTDGFSVEDCEILRAQIIQKTGVDPYIYLHNITKPTIHISKWNDVNTLLDYMKSAGEILSCFDYKWKYPATCKTLRKEWVIQNKTKNIIISDLKKWSHENNLSYDGVTGIVNGYQKQHKGYTFKDNKIICP